MKNQSKKLSLIETLVQKFVGLFVSFCIQIVIYPALKIEVNLNQNLIITFVFFIASIIRGFIIRRIFNRN